MKAIAVGLAAFVVLFFAVNITMNIVGPTPQEGQAPNWGQWLTLVAAWVVAGYIAARISPTPIRTSAALGGVIAALFIALSVFLFQAMLTQPLFLVGALASSVAFCTLGGIFASRSPK